MRKILILIFFIAIPLLVNAQLTGNGTYGNPWSGTLVGNTTWNGTKYINGDITVDNEILTISPGSKIIFLSENADLIITRTGQLQAIGTSGGSIIFTADDNNNGIYGEAGERWGHITFQGMTTTSPQLYPSVLDYCTIEYGQKNSSPSTLESFGGGLQINFTYVTVMHSIIRNNFAGWGGGIFINKYSSPSISNCYIYNNSAANAGGGVYAWSISNSTITNCLIYNNSCGATGGGGILLGDNCGNVRILNCTISNNSSSDPIKGQNIQFHYTPPNRIHVINSILWGSNNSIYHLGFAPNVNDFTNCAIQDVLTPASTYTNCIDLNSANSDPAGPNFTNPVLSDYSITYLSPCIDKGLDTGAPITDIIGNPRVGITDIGAYENQDFLWTGTDGTNPTLWNIAANWNHGTLPNSNNNIIIRGSLVNYPDVTLDAYVKSVLIASGAKLTITAPSTLTVIETLTNNAGNTGIVIKSEANGNEGKLISNTASVPGTVELYLSGGLVSPTVGTFHYFVPPVETMTIGSSIAEVKTNLGLTNFNGDLLNYSESAAGSNKDKGWQYFDGYNSTTPFSTINSSTGYNIYLYADDKMTFTGLLNGTDHSFNNLSFTNLGWNLVGNPYPCNYNLSAVTALTNTGDGVDNTIYFNHNGGYAYWNVETSAGTTGYSNIMPPMQGFFVHVTATGQSLSLPASSKTASAAGPLRSKKELSTDSKNVSDVKKIKLVLNNGAVPDETIVCLIDKATTSFDGDYDAYKLFGSVASAPSIYTELNSVKYAINSVEPPAADSIIIPLTLELKSQGTYKIDITEFENLGNTKVKLKHGDVETPLSKDAFYSFTSAAGTFKDFQLIIGYIDVTTGVETHTQQKIKTWYSKNYLYMNCPDNLTSDKANLIIYDLQGKIVYNNNQVSLSPGQTIQMALPLDKGLYITRVIVNSQHFVSKIVVF
jgi:hypothetical protein